MSSFASPGWPSSSAGSSRLGRPFFEAACAHDLEGIVAKRRADPYSDRTEWRKVLNPHYSQRKGRGERFRDRAVTEP
jgi:hypothetical protein